MKQKRFIEKFEENVRNYPDKVILQDNETSLTFRELDELSGRVYAYLKQKGIGREDAIIVNIPRNVKIFVTCLGIWKAGASLVCVEDGTPQNRIDYIAKDCNCKLIIGSEEITSILTWKEIKSHEDTELHDAALYYYTSGSEGTPKGILHEYGKLDLIASTLSVGHEKLFKSTDIYGLWFPISTPILGMILVAISERCTVNILPISIIRNPQAIASYIANYNITIIGIVPSYLKDVNIEMPTLRQIQVASEIANNIYYDSLQLVNVYGQSEGGISAFTFMIDKKYDNTPIGHPTQSIHECLLDDDDNPVPDGSMGELCYENPFTRGYINDPELTANTFRNGLFHTGDIARLNEDGNYVILGRKTDMIKINGNRIEPAEIEAAVKRVLGIDWAFAKGFVQPDRSFICVYYTAPIEVDYAQTREALLQMLPTYMIPSYFIHVDEVPHLPNGKVDRQAFKAPDVAQYVAEYLAPTNELEERLCTIMADILSLPRIGINDDFYLLGGDSLRTIQLVSQLAIPDLNVSDIYTARTPLKIAERWFLKQL